MIAYTIVVVTLLMVLTASAHAASGPQTAHDQYGYPYPNAPDCDENGSSGCVADAWQFYQGQCTSWVSYRLNQLNGFSWNNSYGGQGWWGSAVSWGGHADQLGIARNGTPALGAVAWYSSGHVAYVEQVNSPTSVVISEMNTDLHNAFDTRTITPSNGWPTSFLHIHDRPSGGDGTGGDAGARLARNGGFEIGSSPWTVMANTNYVNYPSGTTESARSGGHFGATNTSAVGGGIYQDIAVAISPGDVYCASAFVRTQAPGTGASGTFAVWMLGGSSNENGVSTF
ncbi:MAG TPA: CHAP domain-containing protein, partial [Solirubrobacteraceae bacterium]|nr:CHAP domain-containing protein [Solirubrobacteraceae bacterium]